MKNLRLPECRTDDTLLPGAAGLDEAEQQLHDIETLSQRGIERLLAIYGGRAYGISELCKGETSLAEVIDTEQSVLAAEVVFAIRDEFAKSLCDIVYRRMMIGLDADQGRPMYDRVANIAAAEFGWSAEQESQQLRALIDYSDSLRVS